MTTTERPEISVIIPCLNEEANAAAIAQAVIDEVTKETQSYELLFIDNSSTDATVAIIKGRRYRLSPTFFGTQAWSRRMSSSAAFKSRLRWR